GPRPPADNLLETGTGDSVSSPATPRAAPVSAEEKSSTIWIFRCLSSVRLMAYSPLLLVRAFSVAGYTLPYADFCSAVRLPLSRLSRRSDTEQISWGKLSHFPCTIAESTLRTLMDTDFAVRCPLVRHGRLLFGFCPSTRTFVPCFLQTPPRGGSPCIITSPFLHQDGRRTCT